jgi:hypothetical protein
MFGHLPTLKIAVFQTDDTGTELATMFREIGGQPLGRHATVAIVHELGTDRWRVGDLMKTQAGWALEKPDEALVLGSECEAIEALLVANVGSVDLWRSAVAAELRQLTLNFVDPTTGEVRAA